jgi:hypothetical protein
VREILWKFGVPKKEKLCIFKSYYMLILIYGAETWTWTKADISRLVAAKMRFLRSLEGKTKQDIISNGKIGQNIRRQIDK